MHPEVPRLRRLEDVELLDLDRSVLEGTDASYLTLLLASNGVVNFWDQEQGRRIRARQLQSNISELAG